MTNDHNPVFSDIIKNVLGGKVMASAEVAENEQGQLAVMAGYAGFEVSVYTSEVDGVTVVQIDTPSDNPSEEPTLRVYLDDHTLYDSNIGDDAPEPNETETGETK
jgi:hypothetical protein